MSNLRPERRRRLTWGLLATGALAVSVLLVTSSSIISERADAARAGSGHRGQLKKPRPPDAGDVDTLARMLLAWIAPKTGLAVPEPPRIAFVPEHQMRHLFDAAADPDQQPQADVAANQGAGSAHRTSSVLAFYLRATATVYLPETWRSGGLRDQSILLHELVHHVQRFNKVVPACPAALERQAYELQATWLRQQGVAEPYELIGTDEFTVLVLSACMPPDD